MKLIKSKKAIVLLALAIAAISAVGAYAYFTSTGSGTGTATTGSDRTSRSLRMPSDRRQRSGRDAVSGPESGRRR